MQAQTHTGLASSTVSVCVFAGGPSPMMSCTVGAK